MDDIIQFIYYAIISKNYYAVSIEKLVLCKYFLCEKTKKGLFIIIYY